MRFAYTATLSLFGTVLAAPAGMIPRQDASRNVTFCDGINLADPCAVVYPPLNECYNLPTEWNDRISSFQPSDGLACMLWDAIGCQGKNPGGYIVYPGASDLRNQNFNDVTSSFQCTTA